MMSDEHPDRALKEKLDNEPVRALLIGPSRMRVITEHDLKRAIRSGTSPDTPVASLAHECEGLATIDDSTSILEAARLMLNGEVSRLISEGFDDHLDAATLSVRGGGRGRD